MNSILLTLCCLAVLCLTAAARAQAERAENKDPSEVEKTLAVQRMDVMKQQAGVYRFSTGQDATAKIELRSEPILRWNNPVSGIDDGTVFIWTAAGRPEVAAQVFLAHRNTVWVHEFQSLSLAPLEATREARAVWSPREPGVELKALADAPKPAKSPSLRLAQLRTLAKDFAAAVAFQNDTHYELRLLPTPLYRYGQADSKLIDGALFAFVQGTNPEVFLLLEARSTATGEAWHYSLAPMTSYAVEATHKGQAVWNAPPRNRAADPAKPFIVIHFGRQEASTRGATPQPSGKPTP